jgi:hypothetical protein
MEDFGEELTDDLKSKEEALRAATEKNAAEL